MKTKQPKIIVVLEIDQSKYLPDEDYDGIDISDLKKRSSLARFLDKGFCTVDIKVNPEH